jgi:hypothetical protein
LFRGRYKALVSPRLPCTLTNSFWERYKAVESTDLQVSGVWYAWFLVSVGSLCGQVLNKSPVFAHGPRSLVTKVFVPLSEVRVRENAETALAFN